MSDDEPKEASAARRKSWDEFECPECSAHNPTGDAFTVGSEVFCSWCGQVFLVKKGPDGEGFRLQLQ